MLELQGMLGPAMADENGVAMSENVSFRHRWRALGGKNWACSTTISATPGPTPCVQCRPDDKDACNAE